jgi:two-component SAPR family response regulator
MKFLFIDDDGRLLESFRRIFSNNSNVVFAECHSVEDALRAIEEHKPDVIFLDHSLSEGGNEGFEITERVKGIKIYSTTANRALAQEYLKRGVEHVGKLDLNKLKSIINA